MPSRPSSSNPPAKPVKRVRVGDFRVATPGRPLSADRKDVVDRYKSHLRGIAPARRGVEDPNTQEVALPSESAETFHGPRRPLFGGGFRRGGGGGL